MPEFADVPDDDAWFPGAVHPAWSSDGSQIAFASGTEGLPPAARLPRPVIWFADADGTDAKAIVPCDGLCQLVDMPAWAPDGTQVAFLAEYGEGGPSGYTDRTAIEILDLVTGERRTVLESRPQGTNSPDFPYWPRWSPDGGSVVITINRADDAQANVTASAIAVIDADGQASQAPLVLTGWDMFAAYPDWHPRDDLIIFSTYDLGNFQGTPEASNLYTIRPDGSELAQLTAHGPGETRAAQPTWTPDGERIIFTQVGKEAINGWDMPREAAFIDRDGSGRHVLVGGGATHPRLRPTP